MGKPPKQNLLYLLVGSLLKAHAVLLRDHFPQSERDLAQPLDLSLAQPPPM